MSTRATSPPAPERPPVAAPPAAEATPAVPPGALRPGLGEVNGRMLPRQSARCLRYIAAHPGASSTEIRVAVGIRHPSQISRVLHRLERDELAYTARDKRSLNHWRLTDRGSAVVAELAEGIYA